MSSRDYRLDRAKGILIFAVVLGHLLARTSPWESPVLGAPMYLIYSFHMPAFVFLAGITAKSNRLPERVLTFLVLLAAVLPLMWVWMWAFGLDPDYSLLTPFWYTWFLLSMAWWMITVPFIERFPRTMLVASLGMGLFGGILPILDTELSAARTMAFWPFFVIGKLYGKQIIDWAGNLAIWQKLGLSCAALATVGYFYVDQVDHHWLYGSLNFAHFAVSVPEGVGLRLIMDIAAVLMTLALLSWLSDRNDFIATIGKHSLAVYVLHGFVVRGLQPVLDGSRDVLPDAVVFIICLALALVWTGVLSWTPFERALRWYGSTASGLILKPFSMLRPKSRSAQPAAADDEASLGPDVLGDRVEESEHLASEHPAPESLAHPAPFEHYPLPGSHQVPQNAAYGSTQEVPAGSAQPTAQGTPQPETRNVAENSATPHLGESAGRYRRLPVYLSTPSDDESR
ncbi:acyltransferase family protein [Brevibacterium renqingii]|uniref:acyltransferase family protein n=1 Tax=Brevibacterium renqingii TaxID=2776916 RepID=UPI001ADFA60F